VASSSSAGAAETSIQQIERRSTVCMRITTRKEEIGKRIGDVLTQVGEYVERSGTRPAGPPYARYFRWSDEGVEVEIGVPVAERVAGDGRLIAGELPGGQVARTVHLGPYDSLTETYDALHDWISAQGREPAGAPWEVYLRTHADVANPSELTTEVVWPVR
jgi:effector-binding domain-containing protein